MVVADELFAAVKVLNVVNYVISIFAGVFLPQMTRTAVLTKTSGQALSSGRKPWQKNWSEQRINHKLC